MALLLIVLVMLVGPCSLTLALLLPDLWAAEVRQCGISANWIDLRFIEGQPFELCCKLKDAECAQSSRNDSLSLCTDSCEGDYNVTRETNCLVKLRVLNATLNDSGEYQCKKNGAILVRAVVEVLDPPKDARISKVVCTPEKKITLTIDRGQPDPKWTDSYQVILTERGTNTSICNGSDIICKNDETICACNYTAPSGQTPEDTNVTFIVIVSRPSGLTATTTSVHNLIDYVQPNAMVKLQATNIKSSEVHIKFCKDMDTDRASKLMFGREHPLQYNIKVIKHQGIHEELKLTLPANSRMCCKCIDIRLSNLTAYTVYQVIVSGIGGGGEGPDTSISFSTCSAVPISPPHIDDFSFRRINQSAILLMWQALTHDEQGGRNLTYVVNVTARDGFQRTVTDIKEMQTLIVNKKLAAGPATVRIWAQNEAGMSENSSEINIPAYSDPPKLNMFVEFNGDNANIFLNETGGMKDQALAFHLCKGRLDYDLELDICVEYPKTEKCKSTNTSHCLLPLVKDNTPEEQVENRLVSYGLMDYLDRPSGYTGTATAMIKINAGVNEDPTDVVYDCGSDDVPDCREENYFYDYEECNREKSSVDAEPYFYDPPSDDQWMSSQPQGQSRDLLSVDTVPVVSASEKSSDSDTTTTYEVEVSAPDIIPPTTEQTQKKTYLRVFLSEEAKDASSGMVPTKCYFNRSLDSVEQPSMSINPDKHDDSKVILSIMQRCDPHEPQQFLADYYTVYTTDDPYCKQELDLIGTIRNEMFQPSTISLPADALYACVKVHRNRSSDTDVPDITSQTFVKAVAAQQPGSSPSIDQIIIAVVVSSVMVIFLVIIGLACWHVRSRRKAVNEYVAPEQLFNFPEGSGSFEAQNPSYMEEGRTPPELPRRSNSKSKSDPANSGDSGHGTSGSDGSRTETSLISGTTDGYGNPNPGDGNGSSSLDSLEMKAVEERDSGVQVRKNTGESTTSGEHDESGSEGNDDDTFSRDKDENVGEESENDCDAEGEDDVTRAEVLEKEQEKELKKFGFTFNPADSSGESSGRTSGSLDDGGDECTDDDFIDDSSASIDNSRPATQTEVDSDQIKRTFAFSSSSNQSDPPSFSHEVAVRNSWKSRNTSCMSPVPLSESDSDADCEQQLIKN